MKRGLVFLYIFLSLAAAGQDKNRITGKVIDVVSGAPVPNASVFISNTSRGTVTGQGGEFTLSEIQNGSYELIISCVGYITAVHSFSSSQLPLTVRVQLKTKPTELATVTVEPFEKNGWEKWGKFFTEHFIGTSAAASHCNIKNYKSIRFKYSRKNNIIKAMCDEPLIIENKALGYVIKYQLEEFVYDGKERTLLFLGYPLFQDMSEDRKRVPHRWVERRGNAYEGSIMHFMRSLYNNRLAEEGFEVRRLWKIPNQEKLRVKKIYARWPANLISAGGNVGTRHGGSFTLADSSDYYSGVMRQPDFLDMIGSQVLTPDSLVLPVAGSTRTLFFPNYLYIEFKKAKEETAYLRYLRAIRNTTNQRSTVFLKTGSPVTIDSKGVYTPPQELFTMGYWAWSEKIANLLPLDYDEETTR